MALSKEDKQFSRDFKKLTQRIMKRLMAADKTEHIQGELDMLEALATNVNAPETATTIYGLAYLIEEKPWYDFDRGMTAVKEAAERADENEPFCWFILGSLFLNGKGHMKSDPIQAKFWIDKAAAVGYHDALVVQEIEWGDNLPGFKKWFAEEVEKEERLRRFAHGILYPLLIVLIISAFYLIYKH